MVNGKNTYAFILIEENTYAFIFIEKFITTNLLSHMFTVKPRIKKLR